MFALDVAGSGRYLQCNFQLKPFDIMKEMYRFRYSWNIGALGSPKLVLAQGRDMFSLKANGTSDCVKPR